MKFVLSLILACAAAGASAGNQYLSNQAADAVFVDYVLCTGMKTVKKNEGGQLSSSLYISCDRDAVHKITVLPHQVTKMSLQKSPDATTTNLEGTFGPYYFASIIRLAKDNSKFTPVA